MTHRADLSLRILAQLRGGPRSLEQLSAALEDVPRNALARSLDELHRRGRLVTHHVLTDPPRTLYRLRD